MTGVHQGYYQFRRKLSVGYIILAALLIALLAWKIYAEFAADKESAIAITGVTANSMAAHVAEFVDAVDQPLRASASALSALSPDTISPETVRPLLAASLIAPESRFWILFIDAKGLGVVASNGLQVAGVSFADRSYFKAAVLSRADEYFLGAPMVGRISKRRVFVLSRRVESRSGEFLGVVIASIDARRLADVFELALLNADMSIAMISADGKVISRVPGFENWFGLDLSKAMAKARNAPPAGYFESVSPITGELRIFSYTRVGTSPLTVAVGLLRVPWWMHMREDAGAGTACLAVLLVVAWFSGKLALLNYWRLEEVEAEQRTLLAAMRLSQTRLAEGERRLRMITENMPALVAYIDADEKFVFHNSVDSQLTRFPSGTAEGKTVLEVYGEEKYAILRDDLQLALSGQQVKVEREYIDAGRERFLKHYYAPDTDASGRVLGCYAMVTDISEFKRAQRRLSELSRVDPLTGLPNRVAIYEALHAALNRGRRNDTTLACLYLDIDRFKEVNDTYGHSGGDAALIEFSRRLKQCVRETDVVARMAGDEFVILLDNLDDPHEAPKVAAKILMAMTSPFDIAGCAQSVTTSIGVVVANSVHEDANALLQRADAALYKAKRQGRNRSSGLCGTDDGAV